jgi:hypothetical protein
MLILDWCCGVGNSTSCSPMDVLAETSLTLPPNLASVVAAMQDKDTTVSIAAYAVATQLTELGWLGGLRPVILAVAARGAGSDLPSVCYRVARLAVQLSRSESSDTHQPELDSIIQLLHADSHYSVRSVLEDPGKYRATVGADSADLSR